MADADLGSDASICDISKYVEIEVSKLRPRKLQLQEQVERAVQTSSSSLLSACTVQIVGSVSWGGEVPQSDLDLMLCSTDTSNDRNTAIFLLQELCDVLQEQSKNGIFEWKRLEFLDSARIPILCVEDSEGCRCDIGVDQLQALQHRDFLREALADHPHVKDLVRLVKFWVRQRKLPLACEGGLPSLAWVFAALCLADGQPAGTSLEVLLMHFFSEMCQLLSHRLQVLPCSAHGWRTLWLQFDKPNPWQKEWIQKFQVLDPSNLDSIPDITPSRMPTALVALYVAELQMAWSFVRAGQWHKVWQPASKEATDSLMTVLDYPPSQGGPIHVVLKDGTIVAGTVQEQGCKGEHSAKALQRRDSNLRLHLQPCLIKFNQCGHGTACALSESKIMFHPSQWICALPANELQDIKGDAISRIAEIAEMLGFAQTSQGLHGIVATLKYKFAQMSMAMQMAAWGYGMVWVRPVNAAQGQIAQMNGSNWPNAYQNQAQQAQQAWKRPSDKPADLESEESTRASDNESHSSTRSLRFPHGGRAKHGNNRNTTSTWRYIHGMTENSTQSHETALVPGLQTAPRTTKQNKKSQKQAARQEVVESRGDAPK
jgi:hypothetical protein